jgi:hypothetical protein
MSRIGMFFLLSVAGLGLIALGAITDARGISVGGLFALGLLAFAFPREATATGEDTYNASLIPNRPWAYRASGAFLMALAVFWAVSRL